MIDDAKRSDRDELVALLEVQLSEHHVETEREALAAAVEGVFEDPRRGFFVVAREGERLIGLAFVAFSFTMEHMGQGAWLEELYVVPERREAGVGGRLLSAAMAKARAAGCVAMDLEVEHDHARAANLYVRTGFRAHRRTHYTRKL